MRSFSTSPPSTWPPASSPRSRGRPRGMWNPIQRVRRRSNDCLYRQRRRCRQAVSGRRQGRQDTEPKDLPPVRSWPRTGIRAEPGWLRDRVGEFAEATSIRSNTKTGKVSRWTESETGGLVTRDFREPEPLPGRASTTATSAASSTRRRPVSRASGPSSSTSTAGRRASFARRFWAAGNYYPRRDGRRADLPQRARLGRLRQDVFEAGQRLAARRLLQGHRRTVRLDSRSSPTSTPSASWSPAAATAAS